MQKHIVVVVDYETYKSNPLHFHRKYHSQYVTDELKQLVATEIGIPQLQHFNDIPLRKWKLLIYPLRSRKMLAIKPTFPDVSFYISVLKEAALQLLEEIQCTANTQQMSCCMTKTF